MDNDEKEKKKERDALPLTWSDIFIGNSVSDATVDSKLRNNDTIAPVTDDDNNNNDDANDIQIIGDDSTRAYLGGLGQLLLDKLRSYRHVVNQIDAETGDSETNEELLVRSIRVCRHMRARGYGHRDVAAVCAPNVLEAAVPLVAALLAGVPVAPIDVDASPQHLAHQLALVEPSIAFCWGETVMSVADAARKIGLAVDLIAMGGGSAWTDALFASDMDADEQRFEAHIASDPYETAVISATAGTGALPKAVKCTHRALEARQRALLAHGHDATRTIITDGFHSLAAIAALIACTITGGTRLLLRPRDGHDLITAAIEYHATFALLETKTLWLLADKSTPTLTTPEHLRTIIAWGASPSDTIRERISRKLPQTRLCASYALIEACGCLAAELPSNAEEHELTLMPSATYRIVDLTSGRALSSAAPDPAGEMFVRSELLSTGYYNDAEETQALFARGGWLRTGDVVRIDRRCRHRLHVVDRAVDAVRYRGWAALPSVAEAALIAHPDVEAACVVGVPDRDDGERAAAAVVRRKGAAITEVELVDYVNSRVDDVARLRAGLRFVDRLPYTPSLKLKRHEIRNDIIVRNVIARRHSTTPEQDQEQDTNPPLDTASNAQ